MLPQFVHMLNRVTDAIEDAEFLDKPAAAIAKVLRPLYSGPQKDLASGTTISHPLHPLLVTAPIGVWVGALWLDVTGEDRRAATRLIGLGLLSALPAAATGTSDWLDTAGAERRVGLVHAALNSVALGCYTCSWRQRRRGRHGAGIAWSLTGAAVLGLSGWLGGHLTYALGVGVDTNAFAHMPSTWVDVGPDDLAEGELRHVDAAGLPVLVVRDASGLHALADRCGHRGGPLHEGELRDGHITCPWHGSTFDVRNGAIVCGPATRPQPALEVRTQAGHLQVRRPAEPRSLRSRPVSD
jgi:nitrite reductase/ring-hydroxylating ferredoxin subunit/uncharacterized membrane protein